MIISHTAAIIGGAQTWSLKRPKKSSDNDQPDLVTPTVLPVPMPEQQPSAEMEHRRSFG